MEVSLLQTVSLFNRENVKKLKYEHLKEKQKHPLAVGIGGKQSETLLAEGGGRLHTVPSYDRSEQQLL